MTRDTANWVGLQLAGGRYQVLSKLGEGGMAHVYKATDTLLEREVVVKVPRLAILEEPDFTARFTREIKLLSQLTHTNLVKVIDVGQHEDVPFAVMQLLTGGSLRDRLRPQGRRTRLLPTALPGWLRGTALALDFVHQKGLVHRDVKPDNILFDAHGNPFLSDFGIAKALADSRPPDQRTVMTNAGTVLGTPQYMAPEMLLGKDYDGRVDQYALAVTVYESLAGIYPFDGPTPAAVVIEQTTKPPPPLNAAVPSAPAHIVVAVGRALSADPARRFANCEAFAQAVLAAPAPAAVAPGPLPATLSLPGAVPEMLAVPPPPPVPPPLPPRPPARARPPGPIAVEPVVRCPFCSEEVSVAPAALGTKVRCPHCQRVFPTERRVPETPPEPQGRVLTPVKAPPLPAARRKSGKAPPLVVAPPPVGSIGWVLPRLTAGLLLGAAGGYVLDSYARALGSRSSGDRQNVLIVLTLCWAAAGALAAALAWLQEKHPDRAKAAQRLFVWVVGGALGGAIFGYAGAQAGYLADGPMAVACGIGALCAGLGFMFGWVSGSLGRGVAGALIAATLGVGIAALALAPGTAGALPYLLALGAAFGAVWALGVTRVLQLPLPGVLASALVVAAGAAALYYFTAADTGLVAKMRGHDDSVRCIAFLADGKRVVSGSDDESVRVWDVGSRKEVRRLRAFQHPVLQVASVADGKELLAGCSGPTIRRWNLQDDKPLQELRDRGSVTCVAFSADGLWAAWGGDDGTVRARPLRPVPGGGSASRVGSHPGPVHAVAASRDGLRIASAGADGTIQVWLRGNALGKPIHTFPGHEGTAVRAVALSFDALLVASGSDDGTVRVWDTKTGLEAKRLKGHAGAVSAVAFSPDDLRLLSGGADGTVREWHLGSEAQLRLFQEHAKGVTAVAFSPDGHRGVSAGEDRLICVWRLSR